MTVYLDRRGSSYDVERDAILLDLFWNGQRYDCAIPIKLVGQMFGLPTASGDYWALPPKIFENIEMFERAATKRFFTYASPPAVLMLSESDFR